MKILYFLRVLIVSFEFLILLIGYLLYEKIITFQEAIINQPEATNEFIKWITLVPITLGIYNIKLIKTSNYLKIDNKNKLIKWRSYWKIKYHLLVSFIYAVIFALISSYSLIFFNKEDYFFYAYIFSIGFLGQIFLYASIHFSEDRIFEILNS